MTNAERAQLAPSVHFDHHDPDFAKDPWPTLADLRSRCPVAHSETYGGFWVVTGYEDIRRVALDDATFSSAETILIPPKKNAAQKSIPIEMDAPEFLEYRKVMQPLFAPPAVERLAPVIEYYANHCIDQFIERGEVDVVHDFADPVPVMVTLHKLGMPIDDWRRYAEPMHKTVFLRQDNPARAGVLEELAWIAGTIKDAIQQRKQSPRDDMITYLLSSRPFGEPVSDHAAQEMIMLTMQGGFDTTGSAISSALLHLDRNRDDRRRLIEQPELMESAVEEFLRVGAPQFALARTAKRDVELGGHQIAQGDRVLLVWASGNRDESVFERADEVLLDRDPNRHMAFGLGAHRCLGSTLARRQIRVALSAILRRLPDYEVDHSRLVRAETIGVTYGTFAMPITFTPGERILRVTQPFTDAHVHFWDHALPGMRWRFLEPDFEHPRLKGMHRLDAPRYGPDELLAEAGDERPDKVVHIQSATIPAPSPIQESEWLESLVDGGGYPHAIVAGCRLREPDAGAVLAANAAFPRFRGVRDLTVTDAVAPSDVRGAFDAAADHAASVELMLPLEHYDSVARLAEHWPEVTIVLGHAGQPLARDTRYVAHWSSALSALASTAPNVVLKLSAIASSADPTWTVDSVRPVVLRAIEAFGADRCMFASNWPIDRLYGTYPRLIRAYRQIAADLSEREQAALLYGTADRVYRI